VSPSVWRGTGKKCGFERDSVPEAPVRRDRASRHCGEPPAGVRGSGTAVDVVEADDVVFAEVAAGLDLDQLQREVAGVFQAVHLADGDEGGLVLGDQIGRSPLVTRAVPLTTTQCSAR